MMDTTLFSNIDECKMCENEFKVFRNLEGHNENKCIKFVMQQYRDKFDGYNINFKQCECEMCEKWFAVLKNLEEH